MGFCAAQINFGSNVPGKNGTAVQLRFSECPDPQTRAALYEQLRNGDYNGFKKLAEENGYRISPVFDKRGNTKELILVKAWSAAKSPSAKSQPKAQDKREISGRDRPREKNIIESATKPSAGKSQQLKELLESIDKGRLLSKLVKNDPTADHNKEFLRRFSERSKGETIRF